MCMHDYLLFIRHESISEIVLCCFFSVNFIFTTHELVKYSYLSSYRSAVRKAAHKTSNLRSPAVTDNPKTLYNFLIRPPKTLKRQNNRFRTKATHLNPDCGGQCFAVKRSLGLRGKWRQVPFQAIFRSY